MIFKYDIPHLICLCIDNILCPFPFLYMCVHGTGLPSDALRLGIFISPMKNVNFECKNEQLWYIE